MCKLYLCLVIFIISIDCNNHVTSTPDREFVKLEYTDFAIVLSYCDTTLGNMAFLFSYWSDGSRRSGVMQLSDDTIFLDTNEYMMNNNVEVGDTIYNWFVNAKEISVNDENSYYHMFINLSDDEIMYTAIYGVDFQINSCEIFSLFQALFPV